MTNQEMFELAVRGLASQNWEVAYDAENDTCLYLTEDGKRCAWGWVDQKMTGSNAVEELAVAGVGLASMLTKDQLRFARELQRVHDDEAVASPEDKKGLRQALIDFAASEGLVFPEDL